MARKTVVELVDDIDGGRAAQTVGFALDGVAYELDLTDAHAGELRAALDPYVRAGRRRTASRPAPTHVSQSEAGYDPHAVRAWAGSNHVTLPPRGRIPAQVLAQYRAAGF